MIPSKVFCKLLLVLNAGLEGREYFSMVSRSQHNLIFLVSEHRSLLMLSLQGGIVRTKKSAVRFFCCF